MKLIELFETKKQTEFESGSQFSYLVNPTSSEAIRFINSCEYGAKGIETPDGDIYFWDTYDYIHSAFQRTVAYEPKVNFYYFIKNVQSILIDGKLPFDLESNQYNGNFWGRMSERYKIDIDWITSTFLYKNYLIGYRDYNQNPWKSIDIISNTKLLKILK